MTHKCEYCNTQINSCSKPCVERLNKTHVCCTCNVDSSTCELPQRVVCSSALCNLKYQVDWYKIQLEESNNDVAKLKALNNQFRIANIGSEAAKRLVENGTLDITGIKVFVSRQKISWEDIPIDTGYILMCLHEEFSKQWAGFLNEKAVKVQIKKDLIAKTENALKKSTAIREGKLNSNETLPRVTVSAKLNDFEKLVLHNMTKLKMDQAAAESFSRSMGAKGEVRKETKF